MKSGDRRRERRGERTFAAVAMPMFATACWTACLTACLSGCGAQDDSAPVVHHDKPCSTVDERLEPILALVDSGGLNHIADIIENELDPASLRAVLNLLLGVVRVTPRPLLDELPALLAGEEGERVLGLLVAWFRPALGHPDADPPVPPRVAELSALSHLSAACMSEDAFNLATQALRDPRMAAAVDALLLSLAEGAAGLQQALATVGSDGREGFVLLIRNVLASVAAPEFDAMPLIATLDALVADDQAATGPLGLLAAARALVVVVATNEDGSAATERVAALSRLAACVLEVEPDGHLAGYIFDVIAEAPPSLTAAGELSLSVVWLEVFAYATDALAHEPASRDALGQVLALLLRPDLAIGGLPELIALLESDTLAGVAALVADLKLPSCLESRLGATDPRSAGLP